MQTLFIDRPYVREQAIEYLHKMAALSTIDLICEQYRTDTPLTPEYK
jgi:hypothetical protein